MALIDMDTTPSAEQWVKAADMTSERIACDRASAEELEPLLSEIKASGAIDYVFIDTPPDDKHVIVQAMSESDTLARATCPSWWRPST